MRINWGWTAVQRLFSVFVPLSQSERWLPASLWCYISRAVCLSGQLHMWCYAQKCFSRTPVKTFVQFKAMEGDVQRPKEQLYWPHTGHFLWWCHWGFVTSKCKQRLWRMKTWSYSGSGRKPVSNGVTRNDTDQVGNSIKLELVWQQEAACISCPDIC